MDTLRQSLREHLPLIQSELRNLLSEFVVCIDCPLRAGVAREHAEARAIEEIVRGIMDSLRRWVNHAEGKQGAIAAQPGEDGTFAFYLPGSEIVAPECRPTFVGREFETDSAMNAFFNLRSQIVDTDAASFASALAAVRLVLVGWTNVYHNGEPVAFTPDAIGRILSPGQILQIALDTPKHMAAAYEREAAAIASRLQG